MQKVVVNQRVGTRTKEKREAPIWMVTPRLDPPELEVGRGWLRCYDNSRSASARRRVVVDID